MAATTARRGLRRVAQPLKVYPRLIVTTGEPAGIGPDLAVAAAQRAWPCELVFAGDPELLATRARLLGAGVDIVDWRLDAKPARHRSGTLPVLPFRLLKPVHAGRPDAANARYVLDTLDAAMDGCVAGHFAAMVTAPVQKSVINEAGLPFTGHTEYLAARSGTPHPVMLLVSGALRVALATTHLPLAEVPGHIRRDTLDATLDVLDRGLKTAFRLPEPRILVCGLNPHAGEGGHLGREEIVVIGPAIAAARARGITVRGPAPADTAFTPASLAATDAVLAMYHDQGLPVIKHAGFGRTVNVTLGLPFHRTSVDHGTALDLAATGRADPGSLFAAIELALRLG